MNNYPWAAIVLFVFVAILIGYVHLIAYNIAMEVVRMAFGG